MARGDKATLAQWQLEDAARLRRLWNERRPKIEGRPISQGKFAEVHDFGTQGVVWQYLEGRIALNLQAALKFANGLGVSVKDFSPTLAKQFGKSVVVGSLEEPGGDVVTVDRLRVKGSAGSGLEPVDGDHVIEQMRLTQSWVSMRVPGAAPKNLKIISAAGNSMEPTFNDGDLLLVDTGIKAVDIDGIFVLRANNRLYIKRVRQKLDGTVVISSDNPLAGTPEELSGKQRVDCLGRVVWSWNGKKQ